MLRLAAIFVLILSTFCPSVPAQTVRPPLTTEQVKAIDQFVASAMQNRKVPGVSVGVYSRGEVLLAKGYGMSDVELRCRSSPRRCFSQARLASSSSRQPS